MFNLIIEFIYGHILLQLTAAILPQVFFRSHFVAVIRFDLKPSIFSAVAIFIFALVTACSKPFSAIFSFGFGVYILSKGVQCISEECI